MVFFPSFIGLSPAIALGLFLLVIAVSVAAYRSLSHQPFDWSQPLQAKRIATSALIGLVVVSLGIQLVPYGRDHSNPPINGEPAWDSPQTRALAVRACFACHSNEVEYPWYSNVAPVSWAVQSHVDEGREEVNYSEWNLPQDEADESAETIRDGEMPPPYYTRLSNSNARLTDAERQQLIDGLAATFGNG